LGVDLPSAQALVVALLFVEDLLSAQALVVALLFVEDLLSAQVLWWRYALRYALLVGVALAALLERVSGLGLALVKKTMLAAEDKRLPFPFLSIGIPKQMHRNQQ
jgi:hypothetical protein